jgi:lysyl-tRNA synthetase class 2
VDEAFHRSAGWIPSEDFDEERFFRDLTEKVERDLEVMGAVFLFDFPEDLGSLSRRRPDNPLLAERFELYLDGLEICNGFTELTDPREQEDIFRRYNRKRQLMGKEPYPVDQKFLEALETGLPPCAGNALGVDRLLMAMTGTRDISQVMAFPGSLL